MKKNISKFFFRHSLMNPGCGHLVYAYHNNLLPKKIDFEQNIHEMDIDEYLEMEDILKEIDETHPMLEYFMLLKQKVINKFVEINNLDLNKYYQNFRVKSKDMFTNLDFVRIDKKNKEIEFISIQPSVWDPEKLFKKTLSDRGISSKSLENIMGFDIKDFNEWNKLKKASKYKTINNLFRKNKFITFEDKKEISYEYFNFITLIKTIIKDNLKKIEFSYPRSTKLRIGLNQIYTPLLSSLIWKKSKNKIYYNFIYNMAILLEKYPNYKIVGKIAFIQKDYEKNKYSFNYFHKTINNKKLSKDMKMNKNKILQDLKFVREKIEKDGEKWFPNKRYLNYDLLNAMCKICKYGDDFFSKDVDIEKLNTMVPKIYKSFECEKTLDLLNTYPQKIAMLDFETITDPMPNQDYYHPWDKIIVQISCHLLEGAQIVEHYEYIVKNLSKKEITKIYEVILKWVNDGYTLMAYYKPFENSVIRTMERILKRNEISSLVNVHKSNSSLITYEHKPVLDLFDFFRKRGKEELKWISYKNFNGSASIKYTIQIAHSKKNPYENLAVNNGFLATKILYEHFNKEEKDEKTISDLYKYCEQDTLSMIGIYKAIIKETWRRCKDNIKEITIRNGKQIIKINKKGAEILSWKINSKEIIYQKNDFWKKQAPILFPFVGKSDKKELFLHKRKINFLKHGYCQNANFEIEKINNKEVTLSLDISVKEFNYPLQIFVTFKLLRRGLKIIWKIKNNDIKKSVFQLGWHPAFIIKNDYYQVFADNDFSLKLDEEAYLTNKKIAIKNDLFKNFDMQESLIIPTQNIVIKSANHKITMQGNFDYGVLWHQKHSNFLCLEPWTSPCSKKNDNIDLLKRDNIKIAPGEEKTYFVKVKVWL